jgi:hypothetical protein
METKSPEMNINSKKIFNLTAIQRKFEMIALLTRMKAIETGLIRKFAWIKLIRKKFINLFLNKLMNKQSENCKIYHVNSVAKNKREKPNLLKSQIKLHRSCKTKREAIMAKIPIIFIHSNYSDYLKYSLLQAKRTNSEFQIYLLGDSSNDCYDFVEHHNLSEYSKEANEFAKIYRHYSTNNYEFELYCFQRWFVLKEFLSFIGAKNCLYLDSDVMLYANIKNEIKKFEHFDFTLSHMSCGCTFFLNRFEALANFCEFLINIYKKIDKYHFDKILSLYAIRKKNNLPGGACDMTAFGLYQEIHFGEIGEVSQIINGSVYDPSIQISSPGFEMTNGIKKVIWKNGSPFGTHLRTGKEIKFNSLHFQGNTKSLMEEYCVK